MNSIKNDYKIPFPLRLCVLLLMLFAFNISSLIEYYLKISYFPDEILLWLLPSLFLIFYDLKHTLKQVSVNVIFFVILVTLFIFLEKQFIRGVFYVPNYDYLIGFLKFYIIFFCISLIKNKEKNLLLILHTSQKIIIPLILFFYFDYFFGGNKLNSLALNNGRYINELNYHVNGLSFLAVYAIFTTIVLSIFSKIGYKSALFRIFFFIGIIAINSSRGAFLMAVSLLLFYLNYSFSKVPKKLKPLIVISIPIILIVGVLQLDYFSNDVVVVRRIVNNEGTGRVSQAEANIINFLESPYIGKGQSLGGVNEFLNTNGSNVHFTQALASYGFVVGVAYIVFMIGLFGPIKPKMNIINKMSLGVFLIVFISYNWTLILPLSFIVFINKTTDRLKI